MLASLFAPMLTLADSADPIVEAEELVRATWYEGLPYELAREFGAAAAERLAEMLFDPAERRHRTNIALALGMAGHPGAYQAIATAAEEPARGEVGVADFRFRMAVPIAMGHLARHDDRALEWLTASARDRGADPGWSYRHLAGRRLADLLRGAAIQGLGLSARAEASQLLDAIALETARRALAVDSELPSLVRDAKATHARIRERGAAALTRPTGRRAP